MILLLWPGLVFGAEYWVDNESLYKKIVKFEKTNGRPPTVIEQNAINNVKRDGSIGNPFISISELGNVVEAGSSHTIHLIGSKKPYQGGLGGRSLNQWVYGNCVIVKDETIDPVVFYSTRTILSGQLAVTNGKMIIKVPNGFDIEKYRFKKDGSSNMTLTRPNNKDITGSTTDGFLYDSNKQEVVLTISDVPVASNGAVVAEP